MYLFDEDIGRDDDRSVNLKDGTVVPRSQGDGLAHGQIPDDAGNERELPHLGNGRRGGHWISLVPGWWSRTR